MECTVVTGGLDRRSRDRPVGLVGGMRVRDRRRHVARRRQGRQRLQADNSGIAVGERREAEQLLDRRRDVRMFELAMLDQVLRAPGRDHHRRDARPIAVERKAVSLALDVPGRRGGRDRRGGRRGHMVEEAAMLVPGDDQHAPVPVRRVADRFVDILDQRLAQRHAVGGVLRVVDERKPEVLGDRVVSRLDEGVGGVVGGVGDVAGEVGEILDVVIEADPGQQADLREAVPPIDAERDLRPPQRVEDRPVLEGDAEVGARRLGAENLLIVAVGG